MTSREIFIEALADFLVGKEVAKSICLQAENKKNYSYKEGVCPIPLWAREWQRLREAAPLFGYYPDKQKAIDELNRFLQ